MTEDNTLKATKTEIKKSCGVRIANTTELPKKMGKNRIVT